MINKKISIFAIFCIFFATNVQAFSQNYTPSDPALIYQTYFDDINIYPSWSDDIKINKEVVVAVLDSGVDLDHPDLINNIWTNVAEIPGDGIDNDKNSYIDDVNGWDFVASDNDPEPDISEGYDYTAVNHGTVVAGVIAAAVNNQGIVGIAPQAKIMPLKILDNMGSGNTLVLSQAIDYAVENGADIINLSLVGDTYGETLKQAIIRAYNKGVIIVAASGNEEDAGINLDIDPRYPVCEVDGINRVLGVAAVDKDLKLTAFSNYGGKCIDISAPGMGFYSTAFYYPNNTDLQVFYRGGWNGTSVAAPVISATAALIKGNYPELRPYDIYSIIMDSAKSLKATNLKNYADLGAGLVDVGAAMNLAANYHNDSLKIILAPQPGLAPEIIIMDDKGELEDLFLAYGSNFKGGVNLAVGDVDNDGQDEIITAPMAGGGPHIRIFNRYGKLQSEFFAYDAHFFGGVNIAVGDVNGDGKKEIITAPMAGGGPQVRVFDNNGSLISEFFAYEDSFTGGINLATGDVNKDDVDEIIVAPLSNREPEVRVFNYKNILKAKFFAYEETMTDGMDITVGDVNYDSWPEIIVVPAKSYSPQIKLFSMKGRLKNEFLAYSEYLNTGVQLLAKDISGDRLPEILALPNKGAAALLRIYDSKGLEKSNLYLRDAKDKSGYSFEVLIQ